MTIRAAPRALELARDERREEPDRRGRGDGVDRRGDLQEPAGCQAAPVEEPHDERAAGRELHEDDGEHEGQRHDGIALRREEHDATLP